MYELGTIKKENERISNSYSTILFLGLSNLNNFYRKDEIISETVREILYQVPYTPIIRV